MSRPSPAMMAAYRYSLMLYPRHLRLRYREQILQTVRNAYSDRAGSSFGFWLHVFADLAISSIQEHTRVLRNESFARPIAFHTVIFAAILTVCGAGAAVTCQQMLRRGANHPQIETSRSYALALAAGTKPEQMLPSNRIDLQTSLEPFAIFYDDKGAPVASTASLNDRVPAPPLGVFDYARKYQLDLITWQPQPGVRIAAVLRRVNGPNARYILTGRSLRLVEEQESILWRMAFFVWIGLLAVLACGAVLLTHAQNARSHPMPGEA